MDTTRRLLLQAGLGTAPYPLWHPALRAFELSPFGVVEGLDDFWLATDAYIYGYPLVTMEMTRRVMTNVPKPEGTRAPMGQMIRLREYPNASFRDVTAPNADTLYTTAFFDVGDEPWVLSIPDMRDRYALFPMLDGWTNVFQVPGKRTTGTAAQTYAIVGPGWEGTVPAGVEEYRSPTDIVWLLGRIYCTGTPEDYAAVHALQDQCKLVPLSAYGTDYTPRPGKVDPSIDMKTSVRDQVNRLDAVEYFTLLGKLMKRNPPAAADASVLKQYARIGLVPGQDFDAGKLKADFVKRIAQVAFDRIMLQFKVGKSVKHLNGWIYNSIAYAIYAPRVESTDQIGEGAITTNIIRSLCGADWSPTEALLAGRCPADVRPYRDCFRAPVRFDAEQNALVFSAALLRKRLPHAAPELQRLLLEEVRKLDRELALDFPTKVRRVVRAGLIVGQQSAEQTAALFAMQRRTLCRRLRAEGTTFEALVAEIRYEVGRQLLADTRMPIHEIAAAIGYA